MKITQDQLRSLVKETLNEYGVGAGGQYGQGGTEPSGPDNWGVILDKASEILGYDPELQEESDGNVVIVLEQPADDKIFGAIMSEFPEGEWIDDTSFATGMEL